MSANLEGYLEPCGCAVGLLGGLSRRDRVLKKLPSEALRIELGDFVTGFSEQDRLKLETFLQALEIMEYDVLAPSAETLRFHADIFDEFGCNEKYSLLGVKEEKMSPSCLSAASKLLGNSKIRFLSIGSDGQTDIETQDNVQNSVLVVSFDGDEEAFEEVRQSLSLAPDLVLLTKPHIDRSKKLASTKIPTFVVPSNGKVLLLLSGAKTKDGWKFSSKDIPLDEDIGDSKRIAELHKQYLQAVQDRSLLLKALDKEVLSAGLHYVGSQACLRCHRSDYALWEQSKHFHALKTLQDDKRVFDPECVACHVVGFGVKTGYFSQSAQVTSQPKGLGAVGCENCHGAGSEHLKAGGSLPMSRAKDSCAQCHNPNHSPAFELEKYWAVIKHGRT